MSRPQPLTKVQLMRYAGQHSRAIADALGVHKSTVSKYIRELGLSEHFPSQGNFSPRQKKPFEIRYCACGEPIPKDDDMGPTHYLRRTTCLRPECTAKKKGRPKDQPKIREPKKIKVAPLPPPLFMDPEHDRRLMIYWQMMGR